MHQVHNQHSLRMPDVWHNLTLTKATRGVQMFRGSRRCIVMVAATAIGLITSACGSSSAPPPPPVVVPATNPGALPPTNPGSSSASPTPIAGQQLHSAKMADDYRALDRGILTYSPLKTLHTGVLVELNVTVIDIGRGPQLTSAPTMYHGEAVDPYDIPTSAEVVVQLICTSDLICQGQPQSSQFVSVQHEGHWIWRLIAPNPGTALIGIMAVTYEKGSHTFLHATPLWTIPLNVQATAS